MEGARDHVKIVELKPWLLSDVMDLLKGPNSRKHEDSWIPYPTPHCRRESKESQTYLLGQESHRECLIKQPQLSTLTLLIIGVTKDPTIQQRSMDIGHHGADIPCAVGGFTIRWEFDAVEVGVDGWVEVERVAFVEGVDLASGWDSDLR